MSASRRYAVAADIPEFGLEFPFADKLAPRAGFAYDIKGDGNWKLGGSWGVFYDTFKLELPRGSFGGDKWLSYYYTLDTFNWPTLVDGTNCPPACNGTLIRGPIDFRHPSFGEDSIEPDLKPMRLQEATLSLDHQLNDVMAVGARYVHKQVDRAIEDTGFLLPDGSEGYVIANPGEGITSLAFTNPNVALPKAIRDYDAVEFNFDKRMSNNWYLRASYTWSRLFGNYSGLTQSDETNGRTSPNVGRLFDYPAMMFQDGGEPAARSRSRRIVRTSSRHNSSTSSASARASGLNQYVASGLPVSREVGILPTSNYPVNYLGRGSDGRTPMFSQTDMFVQHSFRVGGDKCLQAQPQRPEPVQPGHRRRQVLDLPEDQRRRHRRASLLPRPQTSIASQITAQNIVKDPRFLMDNSFQAPILARFGVKFTF